MNLQQIANLISDRLTKLYQVNEKQEIPAMNNKTSALKAAFKDKPLYLFYEYFHGENGQGLGAAHQTGWTDLLANLMMRKYRKNIPAYWLDNQ